MITSEIHFNFKRGSISRFAGGATWFGAVLLWCMVAHAQYYDSTAQSSAADYLQQVENSVGPFTLATVPRSDALYLAGTFGQLDRVTVPPQIFIEHLQGAIKVKNRFYKEISDDNFRRYILALRIRYEFTSHSDWFTRLNIELSPLIGDEADPDKASAIIFSWIAGKVKLLGDTRTYPLNLKGDLDPLSTLRGGYGSETDVAILAAACLRSVGIASRIVYAPVIANEKGGKVWVEYRDASGWQPWAPSTPAGVSSLTWLNQQFSGKWAYILANPDDPVDITNAYTKTVSLWLSPHPLSTERFDATAMVFCSGRLQPVSGRDVYNVEPSNASIGLGPGSYLVVSGDHKTLGGLMPVTLSSGIAGWYQMDFEEKKQQFAQAKDKPDFFEWTPESADTSTDW